MAFAKNGSVCIHYERMAAGDGPPVILLAGAGRPSTDFDYGFCAPIVAEGFVPIRIDSRDTGRSTALIDTHPDLHAIKAAALGRGNTPPPYGIADMAADVLAVLDAEGIAAAHFVGRSIGGLVAQQIAIRNPGCVLGLALVMAMSRSMADAVPDAALDRLMAEDIPDEDAYVVRQLGVAQVNGVAGDFDAGRVAEEARTAWRHGIHRGGTARHFAASLAVPDLRPSLGAVRVPTLILHGRQDKVIPLERAIETAETIPGALIEVDETMGHDGPPRLRRLWGERIARHFAAVRTSI
ncbi:alpha/beta fold hydrolase [Sphingopyxis terrae]|uniref:alpha/beta fold hydrolase n=1 Tax=Sphingopyxis terrae TaxID=33052 RepID=UPI000787AC33|nr:alpha/beta fold hydrolase [Sphingopyxis terrae]